MEILFNNCDSLTVEFKFESELENLFFTGKVSEIYPTDETIFVGLGKKEDFSKEGLKKAAFSLGSFVKSKDIKGLKFLENSFDDLSDLDYLLLIEEGLLQSSYSFDYYKSEKSDFNLERVCFPSEYAKYEKEVAELKSVVYASFLTRDLVNLKSNDIYPESLANKAVEELSGLGVDVKVYDLEGIKELGLEAFLEVGKGSDKEPRFIVMEYLKGNDEKPIVFVGKGLTYDSGGYSLKPSNGMVTMNSDMAGSATVIGAMKAIAENNLKTNVVGVVAACENLLSGKAYKPGDIINSLSGKKIEIFNTDAEGRVTLADAVYYAVETYEPEFLIDLATLTGACLVALGETYTGIVTNNRDLMARVQKAADQASEKIWELPNDPYFKEYNESKEADIKNSGGRLAGTITAGQFIGEFVKDTPWLHMDIAGTSYLSKPQGVFGEGATGIHVKTLYNIAKDKESK